MQIRRMRPTELDAAISAIRDGGWGDRTRELTFYSSHPEMTVLVADADGTIVGTTVVKASAGVGWVGLVFVAPAMRGRGLGTDLTRAGLARLESLDCGTVLLAASDMGAGIYERLGFVAEGGYALMRGPGAPGPPASDLRPIAPSDLDAVCELDRAATGEDRSLVLRSLGPRGWCCEGGFAVRTPWGRGPVIAIDPDSGCALLDALRSDTTDEVQFLVPTQNAASLAHLEAAGFAHVRSLPRMCLGEPLVWCPEQVFAIFNFALG